MIDKKTKFAIIKLILKMNFITPRKNETAQELLEGENQPDSAVKCFWEPIILATMNQSVQKSSAKLFLNVIRKIFKNADGGKMIFSRVGLSELFANFKEKIENTPNSKVHFESRISNIEHDGGKIKAVVTFDDERHTADYFISAMTPQSFARLMFAGGLDSGVQTEFEYSTIISCYIWTDKEMKTGEIAGLLDTHSDWIFDKRLISSTNNPKYPYLYSITLSNADHLANECHEKIIETLEEDLRKVGLMKNGKVLHWRLLVDKRATISISAESEGKRPKPATNFENLYIAGDWTSTELPATIEGAAQSGAEAAKIIIRKENPLQN